MMSVEGILRAMVRNYAKGNLWDHLDAKACAEAADLIEKQAAELEAARAEIERLENQVQAMDAELWGRTQKILQLEQQLAAEQAKSVEVRDFIARAQVSSGVCCCGDAMDGHASPMVCGHSPVDMWDYAVGTLLHAPSDTSTPEQSLTEYRNKVIEAFVNEFSRHVGGDGEFWLHELQDFAMKEQP